MILPLPPLGQRTAESLAGEWDSSAAEGKGAPAKAGAPLFSYRGLAPVLHFLSALSAIMGVLSRLDKEGWRRMTVVYLDLLFLLNLVANYLLLLGSARLAGLALRRWRIAGGAVLGAGYAVLLFLPGLSWLAAWPCKIGIGVLMALAAFGGERRLWRGVVCLFAASAGLAGLVMAAEQLGGTTLTMAQGVFYSPLDLRLLLVLFVLCYFIMSLLFRRTGQRGSREMVRLELLFNGHSVVMTALVDSGHSLTDPVSNRPVVVAEGAYLAPYLPPGVPVDEPTQAVRRCQEAGVRGARLIPYRAVGVACGLMLALPAQKVRMDGRDMGGLLVALSPTPVDDSGSYQALIGGI